MVVTIRVPRQDLGFWWGHENDGAIAANGNPTATIYGFECPQRVPGYACVRWGSNMSLIHTAWSPLGDFRQGGSIGFDGQASHATVEQTSKFGRVIADGLHRAEGITLGLVAHPSPIAEARGKVMTLAHLPGRFLLELVRAGTVAVGGDDPARPAAFHPRWTVWTEAGPITAAAPAAVVFAGRGNLIKACFNGSAGTVSIFVNNSRVAISTLAASPGAGPIALAPTPIEAPLPPIFFGAESAAVAAGFAGSLEEIYLKNATTENREAYIYTDNVRPDPAGKVYVFDLNRPSGQAYFATEMSKMLNSQGANFDTTQWDGFEILFVMAGGDFPRSAATARSGLYRGTPSPDWYHLGWPNLWGQGVLQGMEEVMKLTNNNTAVECSFMAPGLGPWRPDMVPYVDQRDSDGLIGLGLEWHPKLLFRTEISGTILNTCKDHGARVRAHTRPITRPLCAQQPPENGL